MTRIHIFCEGQTEETFVREMLQDHFQRMDIFVNPIVVRTSKTGKGGVSTYGKIKNQVIRKCREDQTAWVTTMLDFYGLPTDFPDLKVFYIVVLKHLNRGLAMINVFCLRWKKQALRHLNILMMTLKRLLQKG